MRIAIFTNNYLPNPYGVSTSVDGFARGLRSLGHEVYVMAPKWHGDEKTDDQFVLRYPSVDVPTKVPFVLALPYAPEIDAKLSEMEFDIIHSQHPNILGSQAKHWADKKGIPLVFTWHSLYDQYVHYVSLIPESIAKKWVMKNASHYAYEADRVIFPTDSVRNQLKEEVGHDRISVVASGVDEVLFAEPHRSDVRARHGIDDNTKVIATISRMTQEKNVIFLSGAVAQFLVKHPDVVYVCGGGGDLLDAVRDVFTKAGVSEQVIFPGALARSVVKDYLAAADVFVYASTSETQGTIITEAMYSGLPIVAVRGSGVQDVIEDGVSGILTAQVRGDFDYALEKVVYNNAFARTLGEAARARAHGEFTVAACTQKLIRVYEEAISEYRSDLK